MIISLVWYTSAEQRRSGSRVAAAGKGRVAFQSLARRLQLRKRSCAGRGVGLTPTTRTGQASGLRFGFPEP